MLSTVEIKAPFPAESAICRVSQKLLVLSILSRGIILVIMSIL